MIVLELRALIVCRKWQRFQMYNESPWYFNIFEGLNLHYHPSIKYRKDGWGGYEYLSETHSICHFQWWEIIIVISLNALPFITHMMESTGVSER